MLREQEVRDVLNELSLDSVTTLTVSHLNKSTDLSAQQRTMGAGAFIGRARAAFAFVSDPADKDVHHMVATKVNYAKASGLRYRIETKRMKHDDGNVEEVPYAVYVGESTGDADILLDVNAKRAASKTKVAEGFLQKFLADGPKPQRECVRRAADEEISYGTLQIAKGKLKIESRKTNDADGVWMWSLPLEPVPFMDMFRRC
jgi:hypothetical protein